MSIKSVYTTSLLLSIIATSAIAIHASQPAAATPQQEVLNSGRNLVNMGRNENNWMLPAGIAAIVIGGIWVISSSK